MASPPGGPAPRQRRGDRHAGGPVRGARPAHRRSDNGSGFIAAKLQPQLGESGARPISSAPGHPWENGSAESFNGQLRDECADEEVFWCVEHAQVIVERWRRHDNEERPHSALGYRTPAELAG